MAKDKNNKNKGNKLKEAPESAGKKKYQQEDDDVILVRILGYDIRGTKKIYPGLTRIKGVGWTISNIVCKELKIPKDKKIGQLTKPEIQKIEETLKNLKAPDFLKNRQKDSETGETAHLFGTDLQLKRDFDIKKLKKIRSYKGIRHSLKLPVRGQRTRSNFRKNKRVAGMKKKK